MFCTSVAASNTVSLDLLKKVIVDNYRAFNLFDPQAFKSNLLQKLSNVFR